MYMFIRTKMYNGYIKLWALEHRIAFEDHYNCCLLPWADIHHINHKRDDNRIENLEPLLRVNHSRKTVIDRDYRKQYLGLWKKQCPRCYSMYMVKMGTGAIGNQRYLCRDCGKTTNFVLMEDRDEHGHYLVHSKHNKKCPRCSSNKVMRFGSGRGIQRYKCKDCRRDFT